MNVAFLIQILNFILGSYFSLNYYSGSTVFNQMDNVQCSGTELKLTDCPHNIVNHENYTTPRVLCASGKFVFICSTMGSLYNIQCLKKCG